MASAIKHRGMADGRTIEWQPGLKQLDDGPVRLQTQESQPKVKA
jgi:hypothetical protein